MTTFVAEPALGERTPAGVADSPNADDRAATTSGHRPVAGRSLQAKLMDAALLAGLCVLGLYGFGNTYGGSRYFLAGVIGLALGLVIAWWGAHRRQPLIVVVAATSLAFFLFGGAAVASTQAYAGILPSPGAIADLVDGAIQGWARLLTMSPPVGATANLLVIPYLCGMVAGVVSLSVALRTRHPALALPVPVAVLVLSILFGTMRPASLVLQGTLFGASSLWWIAYLQRDRRRVDAGAHRSRRWVGALAMLSVAAIGANFGWTHLPGANSHPRLILRNYTRPPFDPANYPSPLVDYRRFTNGDDEDGWQPSEEEAAAGITAPSDTDPAKPSTSGWRAAGLFEVSGLPDDQRLRLATLDTYHRIVYAVGSGPRSSGYFERVGEKLPEPAEGKVAAGPTRDVTIKVLGEADERKYQDIWLPVPDDVTGIHFDSKDAARDVELAESLVWNTTTGTAAVPVRLAPGDTYTLSAVRSTAPKAEDYVDATASKVSTSVDEVQAVSAAARDFSQKWGCEPPADPPTSETPITPASVYDKVLLIAQGLRVCGGLSDGASSKTGISAYPGHSDGRLTDMVGEGSAGMLGNGEQFAPLAALLSQSIGVPARVVMGFRSQVESDRWRTAHGLSAHGAAYVVRGSDIAAWIEVALDRGHGTEWVPVLDVTPTKPEPQLRPQPMPLDPDSDPPPPPPSIPPSEEEMTSENCAAKKVASNASAKASPTNSQTGSSCGTKLGDEKAAGLAIPAWVVKTAAGVSSPVLVIGAVTALIGGLKSRRRKRRRTTGTPDERVNGGWHEITDLASDLGAPVPHRVTRREAGALIARPEAARLARHADAVVFGPGAPSEPQVSDYWTEVDATRAAMLSDLSRFGRWKALVSLSSLRSSGRRHLDEIDLRRRQTDHSPPRSSGRSASDQEVAPA